TFGEGRDNQIQNPFLPKVRSGDKLRVDSDRIDRWCLECPITIAEKNGHAVAAVESHSSILLTISGEVPESYVVGLSRNRYTSPEFELGVRKGVDRVSTAISKTIERTEPF